MFPRAPRGVVGARDRLSGYQLPRPAPAVELRGPGFAGRSRRRPRAPLPRGQATGGRTPAPLPGSILSRRFLGPDEWIPIGQLSAMTAETPDDSLARDLRRWVCSESARAPVVHG